MKKLKKYALVLSLVSISSGYTYSQTNYVIHSEVSELTIYGTSSLHDWQIEAEKMDGNCMVALNNEMIETVSELSFFIEVDGLKSGKSGMDEHTYSSLKQDEHPTIEYTLKKVEQTTPSTVQGSTTIVTKGSLTVAGFSKEIELKVAAKKNDEGEIQFIGSTVFNMTDYKVDPPTAVFGTISTGDEVTIVFKIVFKELE